MPKVSVCVPIYNVEKYIEKCVRSLFEQTLDDIEYIFVNDLIVLRIKVWIFSDEFWWNIRSAKSE